MKNKAHILLGFHWTNGTQSTSKRARFETLPIAHRVRHATIAAIFSLLLVGCAQVETSPEASRSVITSPLVADVYEIRRTEDAQLIVTLLWPERFGKEIQTVPLAQLDLEKTKITAIPGGRWATNEQVDVPVKSGHKSVNVQSWPQHGEPFSAEPEEIYSRNVVTFYSPNRSAARRTLQILQDWQRNPSTQTLNR